MGVGLKLTRAAILALLKKKRPIAQSFEAAKNLKKGTLERAALKRDYDVRLYQGTAQKPQSAAALDKQRMQSNEIFMDALAQSGAGNLVKKLAAKNRRQVLSLAKRFRSRGGKLSEYKKPSDVYAEVSALRRVKAKMKKKKKVVKPTMFNYPG